MNDFSVDPQIKLIAVPVRVNDIGSLVERPPAKWCSVRVEVAGEKSSDNNRSERSQMDTAVVYTCENLSRKKLGSFGILIHLYHSVEDFLRERELKAEHAGLPSFLYLN